MNFLMTSLRDSDREVRSRKIHDRSDDRCMPGELAAAVAPARRNCDPFLTACCGDVERQCACYAEQAHWNIHGGCGAPTTLLQCAPWVGRLAVSSATDKAVFTHGHGPVGLHPDGAKQGRP